MLSQRSRYAVKAMLHLAGEGPLALVPCASVNFYRPCRDCPDEAACTLRRVLARARESVAEVLDGTSLAAALAGEHDPVTEMVEG